MFFLKVPQFLVLTIVATLSLPTLALKQGELNAVGDFDVILKVCKIVRDGRHGRAARNFLLSFGNVSTGEAVRKMNDSQKVYLDTTVTRCNAEGIFIQRLGFCPFIANNPNYATWIRDIDDKMKGQLGEEDAQALIDSLIDHFYIPCGNEYREREAKKTNSTKACGKNCGARV